MSRRSHRPPQFKFARQPSTHAQPRLSLLLAPPTRARIVKLHPEPVRERAEVVRSKPEGLQDLVGTSGMPGGLHQASWG